MGIRGVYLSVAATGLLGYDADTRFRRDCYVLVSGKFLGLKDRHGNSTSCKQINDETCTREIGISHVFSTQRTFRVSFSESKPVRKV